MVARRRRDLIVAAPRMAALQALRPCSDHQAGTTRDHGLREERASDIGCSTWGQEQPDRQRDVLSTTVVGSVHEKVSPGRGRELRYRADARHTLRSYCQGNVHGR